MLFRGCYLPSSTLSLIQEDGEPLWGSSSYAFASDGTILGENGRVITQQEFHEPDLSTLVQVALEPALTHRGSMGFYLTVTLLALFNIIQICFPYLFFLHRHGANRVGGFGIGVPAVLLHGYDYDTIENAPVPRGGQNEHKKEEKPCRIIFM